MAFVVVFPLGLLSRDRTKVFRDSESLWRDTLATNPMAWIAHNNLGVILMGRRRTAEALGHFRTSLEARPDLAVTWVNLGDALLAGNDIPRAVDHYRRALELAPGLPAAHVGLGAALERAGRPAEAEAQFAERCDWARQRRRRPPPGAAAPARRGRRPRRGAARGPAAARLLAGRCAHALRRSPCRAGPAARR